MSQEMNRKILYLRKIKFYIKIYLERELLKH